MAEEINLLKPEMGAAQGMQKKSPLPLFIVGALLLLVLVAWGYLYYTNGKIEDEIALTSGRVAGLDLQINQSRPELSYAVNYQNKLDGLSSLLKGHLYWSQVFEELSDFTYNQIFYQSFTGDVTNRLIVSGTAANYTAVAKLILGLKQSKKFTNVTYQSGGASSGETTGVSFTLELIIDPSLLVKE